MNFILLLLLLLSSMNLLEGIKIDYQEKLFIIYLRNL
jgi:hypothetical protein